MRREEGLSLIEVLVTVAVVGMISGVIASVFFVNANALEEASDAFAANNDLATASLWLQRDIASAQFHAEAGTDACRGDEHEILLAWADAATGVEYQAGYRLTADGVERLVCRNDGSGWEAHREERIAYDVDSFEVEEIASDTLLVTAVAGTRTFRVSAKHRVVAA